MSIINIHWLDDSHDCETCGPAYATGAEVLVDGFTVVQFFPLASCYGGDDFSKEDVYKALLEALGHTVYENS